MKRKVKLFASIASLCLAVALMAFGVYAATQVTYQVKSTVTYASQVAVTWTGKYTVLNSETVTDDTVQPVTGAEASSAQIWNITDPIELTATNNSVTYVFTCTNNGGDEIDVYVTKTSLFENENLTVTAKEKVANESEQDVSWTPTKNTLGSGETYTLTITVTLKNLGTAVTSGNTMDITLHADKKSV